MWNHTQYFWINDYFAVQHMKPSQLFLEKYQCSLKENKQNSNFSSRLHYIHPFPTSVGLNEQWSLKGFKAEPQ